MGFDNDVVSAQLEFANILYRLLLKFHQHNRSMAKDYYYRYLNFSFDAETKFQKREDSRFLSTLADFEVIREFLKSLPILYSDINLYLVELDGFNGFQCIDTFVLERSKAREFLSKDFARGFEQKGNFQKRQLFYSRNILQYLDPPLKTHHNKISRATDLLKQHLIKEDAYSNPYELKRKQVEYAFDSLFPPTTMRGQVFSKRQRDAVIEMCLPDDILGQFTKDDNDE
jgi:hypothetical protein